MKNIYIGSDHAGYRLKKLLLQEIPQLRMKDMGTDSEERVDYPDIADLVCKMVLQDNEAIGILICGSGQGMAMRANKHPKIRAALCYDEKSTQLSREHNDANVLCLGARLTHHDMAIKIIQIFLDTKFEGGRHKDRVKKIQRPC